MQFGSVGLAPTRLPRSYLGQSAARPSLASVPLPVALLLATMLLPTEFDFQVGSLRLSCQRLVLLVWAPAAAARLFSSRQGYRVRSFDYLLVGAFAYYAFAVFLKEPLDTAIQSGGIVFLEAVGGYLVARVYISNPTQFLATVKMLFVLVLLAGAVAIPESISFNHIARNVAAAITGQPGLPPGETRLGFLRAMAVFDHPIHYGVFCAGVFGLVWFSERDLLRRLVRAALVAGATFLSLSSAPLLGVGIVLVGALWERTTRYIPSRAWLTIAAISIIYFLASLVSNRSPINILATSLVFDPGTSYYRILIWEYGLDNVWRHPLIGLPLGVWDKPDWMHSNSVDNYWLHIAMWGGLPSAVLYVLSIITLLRAAHRRPLAPEQPERRRCRYAWGAAVLALCLLGATVHYWKVLWVYFTFVLGLGGWLADERSGYLSRTQRAGDRLQR